MDKSRQQFEAYFMKKPQDHIDPLKKDQFGYYYYLVTRGAWEAWQASRESVINNLEPVGYIDNAESIDLEYGRVCYLYKDCIDKINIPLYRLDK